MPAIELQRLTVEINNLTNQFDQADEFYASLVNLMEKFANWSYRSGKVNYRNIQLPLYHTPPILTQRLILMIKPKCQANPAKSMEIIGLLRQGKYYELHSLAVQILAMLPVDDAQVLIQYIREWAAAEKETVLLEDLFSVGCASVRLKTPQIWLSEVGKWLESSDTLTRFDGLRAMIASVHDEQFAYLPSLFQLASGIFMNIPHEYTVLMENLLEAFIQRSPAETSFFLQQILLRNPSPNTTRLLRKKFGSLPAEYQPALKAILFDTKQKSNAQLPVSEEPSNTGKDLV